MKKLISLFFTFTIGFMTIHAQDDYAQGASSGDYPIVGLGISVSTFGPGLEVDVAIVEALTVRLNGSYFQYVYTGEISHWKIYGDYTATFGSIGLIADWNFAKIAHLSGGVLYNMTKQVILGTPQNSYTIGLVEVSPEQIGDVQITITPNKVGAYLGIGLGAPLSRNQLVSFNFDIGAVYQGSPEVDLEADGMLHPTANAEQTAIMNNNLENLVVYPMLSFRLIFRLF
jgi:hypothetical protein